jgi:hypothetical protein
MSLRSNSMYYCYYCTEYKGVTRNCICTWFCRQHYQKSGPGSVVGIATGYGLDGPGIEFRLGRDFPHLSRPALWAHPASCTMVTEFFAGVKSGRGVTLTPHPLVVPLVMKEYSYTSTPLMGRTACTELQCMYKGELYLFTLLSKVVSRMFIPTLLLGGCEVTASG